jgi:hypothetical protein
LPLDDDYSHEVVDKELYQIDRHRGREDYIKIIDVLRKAKEMLMCDKVRVKNEGLNLIGSYWENLEVNEKCIELNPLNGVHQSTIPQSIIPTEESCDVVGTKQSINSEDKETEGYSGGYK